MSDLLLNKGLGTSKEGDPVRVVARARTLTVLRSLQGDGARKGNVVQFLYEASLTGRPNLPEIPRASNVIFSTIDSVISLADADLSNADLSNADLRFVDLRFVDLRDANLSAADLSAADVLGADLLGADLTETNLHGALVTAEQLNTAKSLKDAIMPDGSKHE